MKLRDRFQTLQGHTFLWVVLPLLAVMLGLILAGLFAFQKTLTSLMIDRNRQFATISAVRVTEVLDGYGRVLETLASNPDIYSPSFELRTSTLDHAADALEIFNAGVMVVDSQGQILSVAPPNAAIQKAYQVRGNIFQSVLSGISPAFSDVVTIGNEEDDVILVAVPIKDEANRLVGALLGAFQIRNATLGDPIKKLTIGMDGFAYLVDRHGKIVFHPDPSQVGLDVSKLPFVEQVMAGKSGGSTYISATNQQMLEANVPVAGAGWGLIVQESWNSAFSDSRIYGLIVVGVGLLAILLVAYLAWRGVQRIVKPILLLADQTNNLASNDSITPFPQTGILEIDTLEKDFSKMAGQIAVYRAGLRRYVGAMTQSQEDERRRLARELHDETTQNLLAISRRLELYRDAEEDARYKERWQELHTIVNETLSGVRQMSQDLRPLILEDLGLIPALQTLVRNAQQGTGALPHAKLEVSGNPCPLTPEQELAIYRITQEALNNVLKHSRATAAWVGLEYGPNQVSLSIRDDGNGFEVPESIATFTQSGSFGLMGIQERVWAQAGTLTINSNPHQGTQIQVILPIIRETK